VPNMGSLLSRDTPMGEPGGRRRGESLWGLTGGVAECALECQWGRAGAFCMVIASWSFGRRLVSQSVWKP